MATKGVRPPDPHPSGAKPPAIPPDLVPRHVALVMDGDGRWARQRGLARTEGHKEGESSLLDVIMGAIELGIPYLSAYAFSTENWRRSPDEVRFLMGFNRDVIHRRRDLLNEMGVCIRWAGRRPRLWRSVIRELEQAEQMSAGNSVLTLQFCVNYGGRAEIADAAAAVAADAVAGKVRPDKIDEKVFARYLDEPSIPEVDLFVRSSGEQRLSNFLLWQSAYAELVFLDTLWPDFDRRHLWHACEIFASRDRKPTFLGGINGMIVGLVAITPAAGFVNSFGAMIIGVVASSLVWMSWNWLGRTRPFKKVDDTLGVVHTHGVAGLIGGLLVGVLADPHVVFYLGNGKDVPDVTAAGWLWGHHPAQILIQLGAALTIIVWDGFVTFAILRILGLFMKLRAADEVLELGDIGVHQEEAYPDETMVTGRLDQTFVPANPASRHAAKDAEPGES